MSRIELTVPFDSDKLDALTFFLRKKNTTPLKELARTLDSVYEQTVPKDVREYVDSRAAPASHPKPKPAPKPAAVKEQQSKGE